MSVKIIEHKNNKIIYVDHRKDKTEKAMIATLLKGIEIEKSMEGNYLLLANFEGAFVSYRFMEIQNEFGKELHRKKYAKIALVGLTGMKYVLLQTYIKITMHSNIKPFRNEEDAKEWLVS